MSAVAEVIELESYMPKKVVLKGVEGSRLSVEVKRPDPFTGLSCVNLVRSSSDPRHTLPPMQLFLSLENLQKLAFELNCAVAAFQPKTREPWTP